MTTTAAVELAELEEYRTELRGYCYRMLGSAFDADDAVQETLVKAWQKADGFEGRSSLRSWLYRIATNVCLDALRARGRRALPMDLSSPVPATTAPEHTLPDSAWLEPVSEADVSPLTADPALIVAHNDSIRLAFVAALQTLPPKQRAVLILKEVLCWQATEIAELLDTTVAGVNSALQRARATLSDADLSRPALASEADRDLLARYVKAFEAYDIPSLVALLHEDAAISMPPIAMWLQGIEDVSAWYVGFGIGCKGSRLVPTVANGMPAFGQYRVDPDVPGGHRAWSLQVLEIVDGRIDHIHHFLDVEKLFPRFDLPLTLPPA
jgi:RNA polymerase sigma-70 factor (ECF subfamily)